MPAAQAIMGLIQSAAEGAVDRVSSFPEPKSEAASILDDTAVEKEYYGID